jgi:hypothetical protein
VLPVFKIIVQDPDWIRIKIGSLIWIRKPDPDPGRLKYSPRKGGKEEIFF